MTSACALTTPHTAEALHVQVEPAAGFRGWAGCILGAPARTTMGAPVRLRLMYAPKAPMLCRP
ncbi:hypothetical protein [Streptomyces sp. SP2-10]|uniref:hypothetical protein n=1 Tax=Streptomyces sp. SP2-10 TaxID=2873385 RepID=UPI001CA73F99|nr:hypothetical protein [Streptomyces sp. SP2-10]MBY8844419.1 hypothetical protein [Streptomyces sp. SP2-10]